MIRKLAGLVTLFVVMASAPAWAGRLRPEVEQSLSALPAGGQISVVVEMTDQADPTVAAAQAPGRGRAARGQAVRDALLDHANRHQGSIRAQLAQEQAVGNVTRIVPLWILNGLVVTANEGVIRQLAARSDVKEVRLNRHIPKPGLTPSSGSASVGVSEWNIAQIRAPEVWALAPGYDGTGSVVGSFDTGVDGTHPDLAPRYRGNDAISWFDPYGEHATPVDNDGHGTATTGVAVGGDAGGTHIGVAPGAKWIAAKGWDDTDVADVGAFHQIFQWFLAPGGDPANAPDVVNGSWVDDPGCVAEWHADVQALRAARIFPSFASGNSGPTRGSAQVPGIYPEAFAVGATDSSDAIAYFSGRGPSACDNSIKPDISAPGVSIVSAFPGDWYFAFDGTSLATPHVTGAVAVLRSINQALTVDQLEAALIQGAVDLGKAGADNAYGAGRLDLFLSAQLAIDPNRPRVTITATQPTAREAGLVAGTFTVTRTGSTAADLGVPYTVGGTATPGQDYATLPGTVTIPAGSTTATIAVTPIDDTLVEPDESVVVSLTADAAYIVGSAGSAAVTIVSDDTPPDLVVASVTAPSSAAAGATVSVTDTTKNQGTAPVGATLTGFYLTTKTFYDGTAKDLGKRSVAALAAGASNSGTLMVTIPAGTAPGNYNVLAYADDQGVAAEGNEANNQTTKAIQIVAVTPDLVITSVTAPATATAGSAVTVGDTTENQGGGSAGATLTGFYLTTKTFYDGTAKDLGKRSVGTLAVGASNSGTLTVTIPAGTAAGTYNVLAYADDQGVVAETAEGNNQAVKSIQVQAPAAPDLRITTVTAPASAVAGSAITVGDTTQNQGTASAGATLTGFYLTTKTFYDGTAKDLGKRTVGTLAAGASNSGTLMGTIPAGTAPGTYNVLAYADDQAVVAEASEGNNQTVRSIQVLAATAPDLVITTVTAPATAAVGSTIVVGDTTQNQGTASAGPTLTGFYLTTKTFYDGTAKDLGKRTVGTLAAGASDTGTLTVTIPAGTAPGTYNVLAYADDQAVMAEASEGNNQTVRSIQVLAATAPDLVITTVTAPATAAVGSTIVVGDTTQNQGSGSAGPTLTGFYLTTKTFYDGTAKDLGKRSVGVLAGGASSSGTLTVTIPAGTAPGSYYILVYGDDQAVVAEGSEGNNQSSRPIQVTAP